ncbi:hypothetical protein RN001_014221 [Aquatica leii]|uniref:Tetratricopeptide repeat protein 39C n=1 Tax=Aquatica leii TaxID=1421715 RepID=A0AAN7S7D8_9COLE|nr:hypothetical protein RN001_014221 [Aquatica leii]
MAASFSTNSSDEDVPKWKLARQGIQLLINNKTNAAEALFKTKPECIQLYAGYSFTVFMDAIMTLEDDKLNLALIALKETERRCYADNGWLKTVKSKVFGIESCLSVAENLENQIIIADTQVCMAILIFLQQDVSGIFKGGWILRKSWKLYQHTYNAIKNLYKEVVGELPESASQNVILPRMDDEDECSADLDDPLPCDFTSYAQSPSNGYINSRPYSSQMSYSFTTDALSNYSNSPKNKPSFNNNCGSSKKCNSANCLKNAQCNSAQNKNSFLKLSLMKKSTSVNSALSKCLERKGISFNSFPYLYSPLNFFLTEKQKPQVVDKETITRLMGAVSFGYGLFHLGVSLLPPSMLKVMNFFGFGGNRDLGIANLMYAREGPDMRAPLATLALLWYHTIVRPFYAIDGCNVQAGVEDALQLIRESEVEYEKSALFLFFKGRVHRLNSDISEALKAFQASVDNSTHREVKILSLHEVGWCHLLTLDYESAENSFEILKLSSRWSRSFYGYLSIICAGACNSSKTFEKLKETKSFFSSMPKNSQLDVFLMRRFNYCPSTYKDVQTKDSHYWSLFVFELLYLWNTLPNCSLINIERIITTCERSTAEPMTGVAFLIKGNCYSIMSKYKDAVHCFRKCLELRKHLSHTAEDVHISAFAAFELGQLLIKNDETKAEGKALLLQSNSYKGYDFEQRLNLRVHCLVKLE